MIQNECGISTEQVVTYVATATVLSDDLEKDFERRATTWTESHGIVLVGGGVIEALQHSDGSPSYRLTGLRAEGPFPICERVFSAR